MSWLFRMPDLFLVGHAIETESGWLAIMPHVKSKIPTTFAGSVQGRREQMPLEIGVGNHQLDSML